MPCTTVCRARTDQDWAAAGHLLAEHRRWVSAAVGSDVTATQPAAEVEFAEPARFYRPPEGALILARAGRAAAGIVGVHRLGGSCAELKRMYLRPWARGRGLGRALLDEAVAVAIDLGYEEMLLQTHAGAMPVAHHLYRQHGFVPTTSFHDLGVESVVTLGLDLTLARAVS
ncbi:GNAT family N-acetyltransferase [Pseudonocardia sp. KRD-184]|uniref:GNAT family N-acetyltransferase n=1 Tax=Pseudonocardia oceani TaxID=2792013 RepID=A0ABS6UCC4_9PSEU|nr:GNAT family N-acetyltransferase [Pseudonocardia oceani]MBW0093390.1 GNAT family N-acetyltransferase [Pseudonocardia oceani]MBW0100123.1 GNAT family N-acetyltransferase [Pseudonocardia oceani]MBW0112813.1 GNAT family N-acetyltransferase [Pseudonocardia oceani]MBW0125787.1 GNAT family N-acetyltransferase [Pseudonocardia oceani]MBW0129566.1 GNAT family N-acetyltransferase [Pseudonocardia oceani]